MGMINLPEPKKRNLYLAKQVNQDTINAITKEIIDINEDDELIKKLYSAYDLLYKPKPIKLYVDSYGGAVYQCLGLLGVMDRSKVAIHTIVTGCAMSCGFLIAISGHKRFAYEGSTYLYHQVSTGFGGKVREMEEDFEETVRLQERIEEIVLFKTNITPKQLDKVYKRKTDWIIDSKKALKLSVVDELI